MAGGFKAESFEVLYQHEEKSFWYKNRNKVIIRAMKKYCPQFQAFLEIGCGNGYVLAGIMEARQKLRGGAETVSYTGIELFEEGLKIARKRVTDAEFLCMDAAAMDFYDKFDLIGTFDCLEHIESDTVVMKKMYQALRKEGTCIITVPQHMFLWNESADATHVRRYSQKELKQKLRNAGFQVVYCTGFVSLLFPVLYLVRKTSKSVENELSASSASLTNVIGNIVCKAERGLLKCGIRFPFGGSILCVCKK